MQGLTAGLRAQWLNAGQSEVRKWSSETTLGVSSEL